MPNFFTCILSTLDVGLLVSMCSIQKTQDADPRPGSVAGRWWSVPPARMSAYAQKPKREPIQSILDQIALGRVCNQHVEGANIRLANPARIYKRTLVFLFTHSVYLYFLGNQQFYRIVVICLFVSRQACRCFCSILETASPLNCCAKTP